LFNSSGPARPCNSQNSFIPALTLFLPGVRFLTRWSHVIYTRKIPRKNYVEKDRINDLRHSTNTKVTARGSAGYPRVRHSAQKSPKGVVGLAQQVRKIEVFIKRLSVQKSHKGAAGLAQQVRKIEVFLKRLSMQKSPKGAAGLAQQVRKIEVFLKRLSVQKAPKGAAGLAQRVRKIEGTLHPCKSLRRKTIRAKTDYMCSRTDIINVLDQVHNAPMNMAGSAKAHSLIIQIIVIYAQRGHHTLYWFNLRDDTHLPIVKQHYPQLLTLKKTSQLPLTYTRPNRRGQQFPLASPAHTKPTTIHLTHSTLRHRPSPPTPSTRTRQNFSIRNMRRSLRRSHIQGRKVIQVLIRRLFCPHN
jgi:hypothetical protein